MANPRTIIVTFLAVTYCVAISVSLAGASAYEQLVKQAESEMAQKDGKLFITLEWPGRDTKKVFPAFKKAFPFIKDISYERIHSVAPHQRMLIEIQQGNIPKFDIMGISSELRGQYKKLGLLVKPPFEYKALASSLPSDWPALDERALDPQGYFIATTGLARGNAWNPQMVPKGKEPTTWEACLDPMWKGKILFDPRNKLQSLQHDPRTREQFLKWLKGMVKNEAVLNRGQTENLQKIAGGEFPIACGINYHSTFRMIDRGAPLKFAFPDPIPLDMGTEIYTTKFSKTPATGQLFGLWLATGGQDIVEETAYRGFPWNKTSKKYPLAKGKYVALCDAECVLKQEFYDKEFGDILNLPGVR